MHIGNLIVLPAVELLCIIMENFAKSYRWVEFPVAFIAKVLFLIWTPYVSLWNKLSKLNAGICLKQMYSFGK